jgi:hypothetical protein
MQAITVDTICNAIPDEKKTSISTYRSYLNKGKVLNYKSDSTDISELCNSAANICKLLKSSNISMNDASHFFKALKAFVGLALQYIPESTDLFESAKVEILNKYVTDIVKPVYEQQQQDLLDAAVSDADGSVLDDIEPDEVDTCSLKLVLKKYKDLERKHTLLYDKTLLIESLLIEVITSLPVAPQNITRKLYELTMQQFQP